MFTGVLVHISGVLMFLFLFWQRLREDYTSNQIFTTGFYILGGLGLGLALSAYILAAWWFWLGVLGASLGLAAGIFRYSLRFFESFEAASIALLPYLGIFFFADSVKNTSLASFLGFFAVTSLLAFFYFLDAHYKNFSWYASGRVGFSGLATIGTLLLARAAASSFFPFVLSFVGRIDAIISGICAFVLFLLLYNLSKAV